MYHNLDNLWRTQKASTVVTRFEQAIRFATDRCHDISSGVTGSVTMYRHIIIINIIIRRLHVVAITLMRGPIRHGRLCIFFQFQLCVAFTDGRFHKCGIVGSCLTFHLQYDVSK